MSDTKKQLTVAESLASIDEQLKTLFNSVQDIKNMLHGDGKTGLISRVTVLETRLDETKKQSSGSISLIGWLVTTAIAAYAAFIKHSN